MHAGPGAEREPPHRAQARHRPPRMPRSSADPRPPPAPARPPRLRQALQRQKTSSRTRPETAPVEDPATHRNRLDTAVSRGEPTRPLGGLIHEYEVAAA